MTKAYIHRWEKRTKPEEKHIHDFWFCSKPENAGYWETREEAESNLLFFEHNRIRIPSVHGGTDICTGFQVEERADGKFVVSCEGSFIPTERGESSS